MSETPKPLYAPREIDAGTPRFTEACDRLVQALVQHQGNATKLAVAHFPPKDYEDKTTAGATAERRVRAWLRVALNHQRDLRAEAAAIMAPPAQGTTKKAPAKKQAAPAPKVTVKARKRAARAA